MYTIMDDAALATSWLFGKLVRPNPRDEPDEAAPAARADEHHAVLGDEAGRPLPLAAE
jgi:hypothetical protein